MNLEFLSPYYFWLLILIPFVIYFDLRKRNIGITIGFLNDLQKIFPKNSFLFWFNIITKSLILSLLITILANPSVSNVKQKITKNGIDIVITLDISESMLEQDIVPNRLEGAKKVIGEFTSRLDGNRLGILLFAGKPFISSPLTFDYNALIDYIKNISTKSINQGVYGLNGTAIGDALLMGVNTLVEDSNKNLNGKNEKEREKIIILISDGEANIGANPLVAAKFANDNNIKIYTIGIGSTEIKYGSDMFGNQVLLPHLDEKTMQNISDTTGGKYFNASNNNSLDDIFIELSSLTKSDIKVDIIKEYSPSYLMFLYSLIILLMLYLGINSYYQLIK